MAKFRAKVKGEFEGIHEVEAENAEAATEKFKANEGQEVESTATSELEVSEVEEVQ